MSEQQLLAIVEPAHYLAVAIGIATIVAMAARARKQENASRASALLVQSPLNMIAGIVPLGLSDQVSSQISRPRLLPIHLGKCYSRRSPTVRPLLPQR